LVSSLVLWAFCAAFNYGVSLAGGFALPSCLCEDCYSPTSGHLLFSVFLFQVWKSLFFVLISAVWLTVLLNTKCLPVFRSWILLKKAVCYVIDIFRGGRHVHPSNSPHVIAVTHPPQSMPLASENCVLKWLNRAGTRSGSFRLCWSAPSTVTHRAMMDAVKGCSPKKEQLGLGREAGMAL
jgi:hypothetical protein